MRLSFLLPLACSLLTLTLCAAEEPPAEWIDAATGHRVVRLSTEPGTSSFYFHQNAYPPGRDKILVTTSTTVGKKTTMTGISTIDLATRKRDVVVEGKAQQIVGGRKKRQVYYLQGRTVFTTNIDTHETRKIAELTLNPAAGLTVNADETLLAGTYLRGDAKDNVYGKPDKNPDDEDADPNASPTPSKAQKIELRFVQKLPMGLYTVNIETGEVKTFHPSTDWLNHLQFSPTDPTLLMFCHEGPWHKVDRIWTIRTDGSDARLIHKRTMDMEIAGHEFWNPDGKIIWFDLQTPKGEQFWIGGTNLETGEKIRYALDRDQWSVHFNVSPDAKLFAGDGGGPGMVAHAKNGKWIYLFTPQKNGEPVKAERLVNMEKHDYKLEPNVTFSPDMKWIVFRSNMHGGTQVYAVELAKTGPAPVE